MNISASIMKPSQSPEHVRISGDVESVRELLINEVLSFVPAGVSNPARYACAGVNATITRALERGPGGPAASYSLGTKRRCVRIQVRVLP